MLLLPLPQYAIQVVTFAVSHEEAAHVVFCLIPHDLGNGLEVFAEIPHRWGKKRSGHNFVWLTWRLRAMTSFSMCRSSCWPGVGAPGGPGGPEEIMAIKSCKRRRRRKRRRRGRKRRKRRK
ncbi:hypothetical protein E2C01_004114 [Portunus trituberculatus]|uniref:Uncharacterized protein n=1 Tax=Portunus trituberculatus TaxID=210409 RepID=A0A5B7CQQ3_PORTR|nr:hypothetical protein [Portunus trituberculatus]